MPALQAAPPTTYAPFRGPETTVNEMRRAILGDRGERSVLVRSFTEELIRGLQPKDYLGEILAVRYGVAERVRYTNDPVSVEWVKDPQRMVEEINANGLAIGDCDDQTTLMATMGRQLGRRVELITVGFGIIGSFSHIFARIEEPKSSRWIVCDPVAGTRESRMLSTVTTWKTWRID
jgi:hypothetical protein